MTELAPSDEARSRLAQLYSRHGELEEAQVVWSKMAAGKGGAFHVFQAIDSLLANQKPQPVAEITESMVRATRAIGKHSIAKERAGGTHQPDAAARRFQALVELTIDDDEKSAFAKARVCNPEIAERRFFDQSGRPGRDDPAGGASKPYISIRYACNPELRTSGIN